MDRLDPTQEIQLYETSNDRAKYEDMADLYAIIKTVEHLERAYVRDACNPEEYTDACTRLISQFKTAEATLHAHGITRIHEFIKQFKMECPKAEERLLKHGVPATVIHNAKRTSADPLTINAATEKFITATDALRLNVRAVDEIQLHIVDLVTHLSKVSLVPASFEGTAKLRNWLAELNKMRAADQLNDEQMSQLSLDLELAYIGFRGFLQSS